MQSDNGHRRTTFTAIVCWLVLLPVVAAATDPPAVTADSPGFLHVMNVDGTGLRLLLESDVYTHGGSPAWRGDGERIALDAWQAHAGERGNAAKILVIRADGTDLKVLETGAMPNWSPAGRRLSFSRYGGGAMLMRADGSDQQTLDSSGWCPTWSPDGRSIAFTTYAGNGANIAVYDLIEAESRTVLAAPPPDRRRFLVVDGVAQPVAGDAPAENTAPEYRTIYWNFAWSPDSRRICFKGIRRTGEVDLAIVDVATGTLKVRYREPVNPGRSNAPGNVAWSPDGRSILFTLSHPETRLHQIYCVDPDTDDEPQHFAGQPEVRRNVDVAFSPDGKRIVFASHRVRRVQPQAPTE